MCFALTVRSWRLFYRELCRLFRGLNDLDVKWEESGRVVIVLQARGGKLEVLYNALVCALTLCDWKIVVVCGSILTMFVGLRL